MCLSFHFVTFYNISLFIYPTDEDDPSSSTPNLVRSPVPKASFLSRLTSKMRKKSTHHMESAENKENVAEKEAVEQQVGKEKKRSTLSSIMTRKHKSKELIEVSISHLEHLVLRECK